MSKKTDYKKLWRKEKAKRVIMGNQIVRLNGIIEGQIQTMERIRDGKIKPEEILKPRKVKPTAELLKVIEQGKKKNESK